MMGTKNIMIKNEFRYVPQDSIHNMSILLTKICHHFLVLVHL